MGKLFIILGALLLALVFLVGTFIGYAAFTGRALDKQSKAYVDAAVPAIVSAWNEQELWSRASPEFERAVQPADMDRLFRWFRTLGRLQKYEGAEGQTLTSFTPQTGKVISGRFVAKAIFDAGEANIEIELIKHDDMWQIAGFKVNSSALAPP